MAQLAVNYEANPMRRGLHQRMGIRIAAVGWHAPVCHALKLALMQAPVQAHLHRNTLAHASEYGVLLARDAREQRITKGLKPDQFPLASFLLSLPPRPLPVERTLTWLLLEAHLAGAHEGLVVALAQILRGLSRGGSSKLAHTVADCDGPSQLLAKMHWLETENSDLGLTGHMRFDSLWRNELGPFCVALVRQDECLAELDEFHGLGDPLDQPGAHNEAPTDAAGEEPDEGAHDSSAAVEPDEPILGKSIRSASDWSLHMARRSSPDLLRPADNVLPGEVRKRQWAEAVRAAELALAGVDLVEAEYKVLTVLSIETGLNPKEALTTSFGTSASTQCPAIDLGIRALRRPEILPPNCFLPDAADDRWLPTGGDAIFPISEHCAGLLEKLRDVRMQRSAGPPSSLLLGSRSGPDGTPLSVDVGKLRAAIHSSHRLVLAIGLADALGIDAAQRAFGDSFGLSVAPVFYGTYPAAELARVIADINAFAGHDTGVAPWLHAATHVVGSRARPRDPPYARAWERLRGDPGRGKGRPSDRRVVEEWRLRRDRLVVHFMLATGHRPTNSVSEMLLHDFLPRHAMAVVGDKQGDPLHQTRLVCTGWRFVGELEGFIGELTRISRRSGDPQTKRLATSVLSGAAPLFAVPSEEGAAVPRIRALLAELDPLWGERPNVHRHGLCQYLMKAGVDPEFRYFQMGWLCHDHHATSESAPYAASSLGDKLGGVIDDWLDACGWMGGALPNHPAALMPVGPLVDWKLKQRKHIRSSQTALSTLRAELRESERGLRDRVWREICGQAKNVLSLFKPCDSMMQPAFQCVDTVNGKAGTITRVEVEALLAPFRTASRGAAERYVAARILHEALRRTAKQTGARVYLPPVPVISRTHSPSPFLRAAGLAITQVDFLQSRIVEHAATLDEGLDLGAATDLAAIAATSILMHTPCATFDGAVALLRAAMHGCHAESEAWLLRVPYGTGHVILQGDCALLTTRFIRSPGAESALEGFSKRRAAVIGTLLIRLVPALVDKGRRAADFMALLEATAHTAKLIRSNGPERLLLQEGASPAFVTAARAASVADGETIAGTEQPDSKDVGSMEDVVAVQGNPSNRPMRDISEVMKAFDHDFQGKILGADARPVAERRPQLRRLLEDALQRMGPSPTAGRLILEYSLHLLVVGGPRSSGGQAISTVRKAYYWLEPMLRGLGQDQALDALAPGKMTVACRLACGKSRRKSSREVLGEFRRFMKFAVRRYRIEEPEWDVLYREYGQRVEGGDPAVLGDHEAALVLELLHQDVLELKGTDADPAARRFKEVCLAAGLIAEATGTRPRSIHGLTLADILLGPDGEYVHLRPSGRFASVKTSTSVGYIPFEGELWRKYRPWFEQWLDRISSAIPPGDLGAIPLFQIPGEAIGVRYEMAKVFRALGTLIRWSTQHRRGRSYWLRKRRVRARHMRVVTTAGSTARDMAKAMRRSGHALMATPLVSYLGEQRAFASGDLSVHAISSRAGSVALAGSIEGRSGRTPRYRDVGSPAHVARLLRLAPSDHPVVSRPPVPALDPYGADLSWRSVERILRDLVLGEDPELVAARHGVERDQVDSVLLAQDALVARLKVGFGTAPSEVGLPRRIEAYEGWYELLLEADPRVSLVALNWVEVATPALLRNGCELEGQKAVAAMESLAAELGIACGAGPGRHGTRLLRFSRNKMNDQGARSSYGIWPVVRWILVVAWVAEFRAQIRGVAAKNG